MHHAFEIMGIPTAPRHEDGVAYFIRSWLIRLGVGFREDRHGNIIAEYRRGRARSSLAFAAHMDHPGFEVVSAKGDDIHARFLGGVPQEYFKARTMVQFFDRMGCVTAEASVVRVVDWRPKARLILLGLKRGGTRPGEFGMWLLPALGREARRRLIVGRACDDLAGCAAVLAMLENLVARKSSVAVTVLFTRREEIGLCGAFELARSRLLTKSLPIISIETSRAFPHAPQGKGPIVRVGDRSSIFDPALTGKLCAIAEALKDRQGNPFQRKLMDGGTCEATAFLQAGFVAAGLCVALGNYHNCGAGRRISAENIHEGDWMGLVKLMEAAALSIR